ncbi:MAG TPA: hydrogenase small subunit [Desulfobacteria bacterium]|nr:hydrogenase small subunit [Desulfobacteria bacterium]
MLTRREFLSLCTKAALTTSLAELLLTDLGQAVLARESGKPTVIWLELGSCTGNSISFDNVATPSVKELFSNVIDVRYHWLFMNVEGHNTLAALRQAQKEKSGQYILVVEGSAMLADGGSWDIVAIENGRPVTGLAMLQDLGAKAKHVIAIGTCAAFGGPSATHPNPSQSVGVQEVLGNRVINTPGCPCHPDWFIGTLYHLINYGIPEMDAYNRPKLFYGRLLHDQCQRRTYFEKGIFANNPGEPWCMFKIGCRGPITFADCPNREWNQTDNWPVGCNTPCIGCVEPGFPDISMPFFQRYPDVPIPTRTVKMEKAALALGVGTLGAIGMHFAGNIITKRLRKNLAETSMPLNPPGPHNLAQLEGIKAVNPVPAAQQPASDPAVTAQHAIQQVPTQQVRTRKPGSRVKPKRLRRTLKH